jgi:hypothetical protein
VPDLTIVLPEPLVSPAVDRRRKTAPAPGDVSVCIRWGAVMKLTKHQLEHGHPRFCTRLALSGSSWRSFESILLRR